MSDIRHRTVETNGIRMHVAEAGRGPLVVLCHGFPESWYSWRHQLVALARYGSQVRWGQPQAWVYVAWVLTAVLLALLGLVASNRGSSRAGVGRG